MRIAIWHNLPSGGGKRALYSHVQGLVGRGHQVESWCPPTADPTYLPLSQLCLEHIVPLSMDSFLPWLRRGRALLACQQMSTRLAAMDHHCRECAAQMGRGGFDVLLANSCVFFRVTSIAKHVSIPAVLYLQEPYRWLYEALPRLPWVAPQKAKGGGWPGGRWARYILDPLRIQSLGLQAREGLENAAAFDAILVNSLYSRESLLRTYGLESQVCYLGIDTEQFRPTGEPVASYAMGLGGLSFAKAPDRAIRALGCVDPRKRPELVWVGNFSGREYEREIQALAAGCGVKLEVKIRVSDAELISLLSRAAMLIYTPRLEPFGLAPLEANACGTPVVGIAEGGLRETIRHLQNGLLVQGDDPKLLAEAIERLIDNPALAQDLRERSLHYARTCWPMKEAIDRLESALIKASRTSDRGSR